MRTQGAIAGAPCEVVAFDVVALSADGVVVVDGFTQTGRVPRLFTRH